MPHERHLRKSDSLLSQGSCNLVLMTTQNAPQLAWTVIYVSDVSASLALYTEAFGLTVGFEHPGGDYAEFVTGATALALCERALAADSTGLALDGQASPRSNITLVVENVTTAFTHAVAAGATSIAEPMMKPWGQESSYVADLDGNLIEFASRVAP